MSPLQTHLEADRDAVADESVGTRRGACGSLRQIRCEACGIPTVALSMIPELTRAVGVPRLAGISYPMGRPLGRPHDADGQRAVLRRVLEVLSSAPGPDTYIELPFVWPESPQARNASKDLPPARHGHVRRYSRLNWLEL